MQADTGASASARSSMSSLVPPPARRAMPPRNDVKLPHCRTLGHRVVLLVDDDIGVLEGLERVLRRQGLDVFCTTSARGALEILRATRVDVVVSDDRIDAPIDLTIALSACATLQVRSRVMWATVGPLQRLAGVHFIDCDPSARAFLQEVLFQALVSAAEARLRT